ncbi:hypothetical protein QWI18_01085 [Pseudomonas sp. W2Oct36]|uniref:hypothetical protein n=1 Tax=unclassified Pseudomonas TaxID=196821 RepID=UPI0034E0C953
MITEHPVRLFLTALVAVALSGCSYSDLKPQSSVWQGLKVSSKKTLDEAPVSDAH